MSHHHVNLPSVEHLRTSDQCRINKLPFDLLYEIFRYAYYTHSSHIPAEMPLAISHVCRRWRQYALDIPILWNTLVFRRKTRYETWDREKAFLERSKDAPLGVIIRHWPGDDIGLSTSAMAGILRLIKPHISRWVSLVLHAHIKGIKVIYDQLRHSYAPALKRVEVDTWGPSSRSSKREFHLFGGGLPSLQHWRSHLPVVPSPSLPQNMENLRNLFITGSNLHRGHMKVNDIVVILSKCPGLEKLGLYFPDTLELNPLHQQIIPQISLPQLSSLYNNTIDSWHILPIFHFIKAPSLRYLASISNNIIPLIAAINPFPRVQNITFHGETWCQLPSYDTLTLWTAFSNLSSLTKLGLGQQEIHSKRGILQRSHIAEATHTFDKNMGTL
ncbi:hypothetical protein FRC03_000715 [Tulasnella sp. 419]|nr:hypothetical protein FRC03_000715 [Tulasnella sp. 419]